MDCSHVRLPGGGVAIVCGRGRRTPRCRWCVSRPGKFQCDWHTGEGAATCDKHLCSSHALQVGPDKHLCPEHTENYRAWLRDVVGIAY